jgi:hypothetical protein
VTVNATSPIPFTDAEIISWGSSCAKSFTFLGERFALSSDSDGHPAHFFNNTEKNIATTREAWPATVHSASAHSSVRSRSPAKLSAFPCATKAPP